MPRTNNIFNIWPRKGKTVQIENISFPSTPTVWFGFALLGGSIFAFAPAWTAFSRTSDDGYGKLAASIYSLFFGGIFAVVGVLLLYVSWDIRRARPIKELSKQLGLSEAELDRLAHEKGIVPRYTNEGSNMYRPADFDITGLLRASTVPLAMEELLRAAENEQSLPEHLVRAASAPMPTSAKLVEPRYAEEPLEQAP